MLSKLTYNLLMWNHNRRLTNAVLADLEAIRREEAQAQICTMQSEKV